MSRPRTQIGHGVYAWALREKCPCTPCRNVIYRTQKQWRTEPTRKHPIEPVRARVQHFIDAGATVTQVARAAGIQRHGIRNILGQISGKEPAQWVLRDTYERIMDISYEEVFAQERMIPAVGLARRIDALEWMGHTKQRIATELGVSQTAIHHLIRNTNTFTSTRDKVHQAYVALRDQPGISEEIRWKAYRRNAAPPAAWDDETIDDPDVVAAQSMCIVRDCIRQAKKMNLCPRHHEDLHRRHRQVDAGIYRKYVIDRSKGDPKRSVHEITIAVAELKEMGLTPVQIAERLHRSVRHIERYYYR